MGSRIVKVNRGRNVETASNSASTYSGGITIKSPQELDSMRRAGAVVGAVIDLMKASVEPGMTTKDLGNLFIRDLIQVLGGHTGLGGARYDHQGPG